MCSPISYKPSPTLLVKFAASAPSMMPVSSAVKISVKSITIGDAPKAANTFVARPGGERNFQSLKSAAVRIGLVDTKDSGPGIHHPTNSIS